MTGLRARRVSLRLMALGTTAIAVMAVMAAAAPPPAAAFPVALPVPADIDSTGRTDVTSRLNAFLASVPPGRTVVFQAGGRYRIEGSIWLRDKEHLRVNGNGATFFATTEGDRTRGHWRIQRGNDVEIYDMSIQGAHPNAGMDGDYVASLEAQHGLTISGAERVHVHDVSITDVYGDFVYMGIDTSTGRWASDVDVHDSVFARNGRQGIALTGVRRVRITNNTIGDTRRTTFDLEPNGEGWGVTDVVIEANRIGRGRLNFVAAVGSGEVNRIIVRNNVLSGRAMNMKVGNDYERRSNWVVAGNTSGSAYGNAGGAAMWFKNVDSLLVTGNRQPLQAARAMNLVDTMAVCSASVIGNNFEGGAGEHRVSRPCPIAARPDGLPTTGCTWLASTPWKRAHRAAC